MSQAEAADLLKMSQAGYSKLEAGLVDTPLSTVAKAADVTQLSPAALMGSPAGLPAPLSAGGSPSLPEALKTVLDAGYRVERIIPQESHPISPET